MNTKPGAVLSVVIFLSFCGPIFLAMILLGLFGLGEYTMPIFVPILAAMCFFSILTVAALRIPQRRTMASQRLAGSGIFNPAADSLTGDDTGAHEHVSLSAVFTIPVRCPHCRKSIELDRVHWDSAMVLVCTECLGDVRVKILE